MVECPLRYAADAQGGPRDPLPWGLPLLQGLGVLCDPFSEATPIVLSQDSFKYSTPLARHPKNVL